MLLSNNSSCRQWSANSATVINVVFVRMSCELISLRSPTAAWFAARLS
jgi:hypothetical protein